MAKSLFNFESARGAKYREYGIYNIAVFGNFSNKKSWKMVLEALHKLARVYVRTRRVAITHSPLSVSNGPSVTPREVWFTKMDADRLPMLFRQCLGIVGEYTLDQENLNDGYPKIIMP